jgi:hypothetical protein
LPPRSPMFNVVPKIVKNISISSIYPSISRSIYH